MIRLRFFQQIALTCLILSCAHTTFATPEQLSTCPSIEQLQSLSFSCAFPIGFDPQTNKFHYLTLLIGNTSQSKDYVLFLSPVDASPGQSPELSSIQQQLATLHANSDAPISNRICIIDELSESRECTYSSDDNNVHAILYVEEEGKNDDFGDSNTTNLAGLALRQFALGHS